MKIIVRNNNAVKAYKVLTKKLKKEGIFEELKQKRYALSKSQRKRLKKERALVEFRKNEKIRKQLLEKEDRWLFIQSKKKAKEMKKSRDKSTFKK